MTHADFCFCFVLFLLHGFQQFKRLHKSAHVQQTTTITIQSLQMEIFAYFLHFSAQLASSFGITFKCTAKKIRGWGWGWGGGGEGGLEEELIYSCRPAEDR